MQKQLVTLCLTCRTITTTHFHIFQTELLWVKTALVMMMMMMRTNDMIMNLKTTRTQILFTNVIYHYPISKEVIAMHIETYAFKYFAQYTVITL